ncbi:MAG: cobalamin-dependent protein, partial [Candidatus Helarchaeales archaeon]
MKILIVDALGAGKGIRRFTRDVIGCGPRLIAGLIEEHVKQHAQIVLCEELSSAHIHENDVLFISAMSMDFTAVKKTIRKWRKKKKKSLVVIGGPISTEPRKVLLQLGADLAVMGEAELTLLDFFSRGVFSAANELDDISLREIPGIAFRLKNQVIVNESRRFLTREEFNSFKPSIHHLKDYPNFSVARVHVETVRGCSNFHRPKLTLPNGKKCTECGRCEGTLSERLYCPEGIPPGCGFCSVPSTFGPPKSRDVDNLTWEISELVELGVRRIVLSAPDFLDYYREELVLPDPLTDPFKPPANLDMLERLLDEIKNITTSQKEEVNISIENVKASLLDEQVVSLIARYLPGTTLSVGCESGSAS